jgi:hypothetical protein
LNHLTLPLLRKRTTPPCDEKTTGSRRIPMVTLEKDY